MNDTDNAKKQIQQLIKQAETILTECERIAKKNKVDFRWDGPSYGMGGWYIAGEDDEDWDGSTGWQASSHSC